MPNHPSDCNCPQCEGLRLYPEVSFCDWCQTEHTGNANNCPDNSDTFTGSEPETIEDEQLMWATLGAIREITKRIKENTMIPRSTAGQQQSRGGGQTQPARTGLPYLNQKNMTDYLELDVHYPVKIIECRVNSNVTSNQSPVVLKLVIKGKTVLWGLRTNNPSLEILTEMFGQNENDWANQAMEMWLHEDDFDGRIWPTVGAVSKEKKK